MGIAGIDHSDRRRRRPNTGDDGPRSSANPHGTRCRRVGDGAVGLVSQHSRAVPWDGLGEDE